MKLGIGIDRFVKSGETFFANPRRRGERHARNRAIVSGVWSDMGAPPDEGGARCKVIAANCPLLPLLGRKRSRCPKRFR